MRVHWSLWFDLGRWSFIVLGACLGAISVVLVSVLVWVWSPPPPFTLSSASASFSLIVSSL